MCVHHHGKNKKRSEKSKVICLYYAEREILQVLLFLVVPLLKEYKPTAPDD